MKKARKITKNTHKKQKKEQNTISLKKLIKEYIKEKGNIIK